MNPLRAKYMVVAAQDRALRADKAFKEAQEAALAWPSYPAPDHMVARWAWTMGQARKTWHELRTLAMSVQHAS